MNAPGFETRSADWLEVQEARDRVLASGAPLETERVELSDAIGRALAHPLDAPADLPPWDNSAMDGYAVVGSDVERASGDAPVTLTVVRAIRAGEPPGAAVGRGQAVRIMTGAPVPPGADSVIRVEHTDGEAAPGAVRVSDPNDVGRNIRPAGEDMRKGERVLDAGLPVTHGVVAALTALGLSQVEVHRRPRIAVLPTGDELRTPDRYADVLAGAGVPETNGPLLAAAVRAAGGTPTAGGIVPDDPAALRSAIERSGDADALVTIGGASMGEADLVKRVLDTMGYRQDFWRVRMRPGSPFGFGWLPRDGRDQAVFSLPGNPASAFVTFELFVRPWLLRLAGHRRVLRRTLTCVAGEPIEAPAELTYFLRARLDGRSPPVATLAGPQGSGLVRTLALADGLLVVPPDVARVEEGQPVEVLLLDDGPAAVEPGTDA